jgi:catechol 2,3-dioxygenase-like lactoylglutathione lyase family enzyme
MLPESDLAERESGGAAIPPAMVSGGHAIVYVSSMDNAVRFYTEVLGLKLTNRYGDNFATVEAGRLVIALHPQTPNVPAPPGTKGSMALGLAIDEAAAFGNGIDGVVARLTERGVRITGEIDRSRPNNVVEFEDPDGNDLYLWQEPKPAQDRDRDTAAVTAAS